MNDGGPAFPLPCQDDRDCNGRYQSGYGGMSLRDWFAGRAIGKLTEDIWETEPSDVARAAYRLATAMLAERERRDDA